MTTLFVEYELNRFNTMLHYLTPTCEIQNILDEVIGLQYMVSEKRKDNFRFLLKRIALHKNLNEDIIDCFIKLNDIEMLKVMLDNKHIKLTPNQLKKLIETGDEDIIISIVENSFISEENENLIPIGFNLELDKVFASSCKTQEVQNTYMKWEPVSVLMRLASNPNLTVHTQKFLLNSSYEVKRVLYRNSKVCDEVSSSLALEFDLI